MDVAAVYALSEDLVGASWWSTHGNGARLDALLAASLTSALGISLAVGSDVFDVGASDLDTLSTLDVPSARVTASISAQPADLQKEIVASVTTFVRAHGLKPEFLLGLPSGHEWLAAFRHHLIVSGGGDLTPTQGQVLRSRLVAGVVAIYNTQRLATPVTRWIEAQPGDRLEQLTVSMKRVDALSRVMREDLASGRWVDPGRRLGLRSTPMLATSTIGRRRELDGLRDDLLAHRHENRIIAVSGLSGSGKTHLAKALTDLVDDEYDIVWWLPQKTQDGHMIELRRLADAIGLVDLGQDTPGMMAARVKAEIDRHRYRTLLVVDDVHDVDLALAFGGDRWGHVVVTTQRRDLPVDLPFPISGLKISEVFDVADHVDGIEQIRRQPDQTVLPIDLFGLMRGRTTVVQRAIAPSDILSGVRRADPVGADIIAALALLESEQLPLRPFLSSEAFRRHFNLSTFEINRRTQETLRSLDSFGLVTLADSGSASMHDTTRARIRETLNHAAVVDALDLLQRSVVELIPDSGWLGQPTTSPAATAGIHALRLFDLARAYPATNVAVRGALGLRVGTHLNSAADRLDALRVLREAVNLLGAGSASHTRCRIEIGRATRHVGHVGDALSEYASLVSSVDFKADPDTGARFVTGLSRVLLDGGQTRLAEMLCGAFLRSNPSREVPFTLAVRSMHGRAVAERHPAVARARFSAALDQAVEVLGPEAQPTGWALDDLGASNVLMGNAAGAHDQLTRALAIETATSGVRHPRRAWTLMNVASVSVDTEPGFTADCIEEAFMLQAAAVSVRNPDYQRFVEARRRIASGDTRSPLQRFNGSLGTSRSGVHPQTVNKARFAIGVVGRAVARMGSPR